MRPRLSTQAVLRRDSICPFACVLTKPLPYLESSSATISCTGFRGPSSPGILKNASCKTRSRKKIVCGKYFNCNIYLLGLLEEEVVVPCILLPMLIALSQHILPLWWKEAPLIPKPP